jgi:hypothetical protein
MYPASIKEQLYLAPSHDGIRYFPVLLVNRLVLPLFSTDFWKVCRINLRHHVHLIFVFP